MIDAKPTWIFLFATVVGLFLLIFKDLYLYGVILTISALSCGMFFPRTLMMAFYPEYLILYNRADRSDCVLIYYNEVVSWHYTWSAAGKDYLYIELEDGSTEKIEAFSKGLFESRMKRVLREKQRKNG